MLLLAASAAFFAQSGPPADPNSASVEGVVVNAVTGAPVLRAHVTLRVFGRGRQRTYGAMTTAEGKFSVTGLPGGNYYVAPERVGFFFNWRGPALELKPGEHKDDVTLKLTPTGAISGTVVDANGEPVENCTVSAESYNGAQWQSSSDAQGRFRIGGLLPGKYRIKAEPEEQQTPPEIRTDGTEEVHYSRTYYPSALDQASGEKVSAEPGTETGAIEIRLVRTPVVRVSGKVTGIPQGAENVDVTAQRKPENRGFVGSFQTNGRASAARVKKDGTFALWRLAPGAYRITAQWGGPAGQRAASAPAEIVVGDSNVDGLELRMMAAADVTGQVEYESDDARPAAPPEPAQPGRRIGQQVNLQGFDGTLWGGNGRPEASGAFTIEKVLPGRYHVMYSGGPGYVKSMRLGTAEVAGDVLDLSNGAAGGALTVLVSTQYGSVSGAVQSDGAAAAGLRVLLMLDSQEPGGMRNQAAAVGADGSYSFNSVIPGAYKLVAAAEDDVNGILQGGDEWDKYASVTETVTIRAGEKATQDLKVLAR
ncbi:MAG: carboxypeptidase-like regulatory domain-containing protein [Bryobacteraceae bacterium]